MTLLALLSLSCGKHSFDSYLYSSVTFFNNSSYYVSIHSSSFNGPVLIDKLASGMRYSTTLNPSDNYGIGSMFSIEYWHLVASDAEFSCGDVWTSGIDPNAQISQNIEEGKDYVIKIPQPKNLELKEAFLKILNTSDNYYELNRLGTFYRQAGNGEISVSSGKVGIYKLLGGVEIKGYTITQVFNEYPFPEFTAKNGYIYDFEFNGHSVEKTGEQKIIF
ncbi:MAG: hypothetical protein LBC87_09490 [Fibromonadaceae bacterium]|nr:hypothetical protein [Fibromonadaceae bacterium]